MTTPPAIDSTHDALPAVRERVARDVLAVGPYPPPITGQSVAFAAVVDNLGMDHADIGSTVEGTGPCATVRRAVEVLGQAARAWVKMRGRRALYVSTASSLFGVVRDSLIVLPALCTGKRIAVHIHQGRFDDFLADLNPPARAYVRWLYRRFRRIIVLSKTFTGQFAFARPERIAVVANSAGALDAPIARPPADETRVLYLSNLIPSKGPLPLIEAMALLPGRYRLTLAGAFIVAGDDPYPDADAFKRAVNETIDRLGLADRVRLAGVVSGAEKDRILAESHVLALPTTYVNEAQPLCVAEAMLAGVPVVTTDHRDLKVMVGPDRGRIVEAPDPEPIARAIREVCDDPRTWAGLSAGAHAFARERHGFRSHLAAVESVLLGMLDEP